MALKSGTAAALLLILHLSPAIADEPVIIGRDAGFDACGAISQTKTQTNVHADPARQSRILDVLAAGVQVWDCDWKELNGEAWSGVVYSLEPDKDCGPMGTPIPEPRDYVGPCHYGWVNRDDLILIAG